MEPASGTPGVLGLPLLLCSSLLLNALLVAHHFLSATPPPPELLGNDGGSLSWALQAARKAESVAATGCSGHGRVFLDGIAGEDGRPGCECNACFQGADCSVRTPDCTVNADRQVNGKTRIRERAGWIQLSSCQSIKPIWMHPCTSAPGSWPC